MATTGSPGESATPAYREPTITISIDDAVDDMNDERAGEMAKALAEAVSIVKAHKAVSA